MTAKPIAAHELRALWQSMPTTPVIVSPAEMRAGAQKFQAHIRRRNITEYVAALVVAITFGWYATWAEPATPLWPIANILIVIGALVSALNWHRRARAASVPPAASTASLIEFQRAELTRQRDALLSAWRWYLLPLLPGLALWLAAIWMARTGTPHPELALPIIIAVVLCFTIVVMWVTGLQLLGAARLQRMIEDLDRYREK
jgi:hypothetical protein